MNPVRQRHGRGVLDDHYLGQERPLGEARLLFETGEGVSLRELRGRLGLDAGLPQPDGEGPGGAGPGPARGAAHDNRPRMVMPTPAGRAEGAEQQHRADALVAGLLAGLTPRQRAELTGAMATAERLLLTGRDQRGERQRCLGGRAGLSGRLRGGHRRALPRGLRQGGPGPAPRR